MAGDIDPAVKRKTCHLLDRLERHHPASFAHSLRVARLSMAMWRAAPGWMGCGETALVGSLLHDVGKLNVPLASLASDRRLSIEERQAMTDHARGGAEMLAALGLPGGVVEIAAHHHERWAAGGYPSGRPASCFAPVVRAVAVADAFIAMTEPGRPYRRPMSHEAGIQEVEACSGTHFDPEAVAILVGSLSFWREEPVIRRSMVIPETSAERFQFQRDRFSAAFGTRRRGPVAASHPEPAL